MADTRQLYQEVILDHNRKPRNWGTLPDATHHAEGVNPLCGDQIRIELKVSDGKVEDVRFSGKGCAISQAATSMLTQTLRGQALEDVARIPAEQVVESVGIGISPVRMKCATLGLKVLKTAALGEIASWPEPVSDEPPKA